jgi:very-short-patch-repair endonuclease
MGKSELEEKFLHILEAECVRNCITIEAPTREHRFHPTRKWRFDFAWPSVMVAVEIEGGTWAGGRHNTGAGMAKDCDKYNAATQMGWKVLRFTSSHLKSPDAVFEAIMETMGFFKKAG